MKQTNKQSDPSGAIAKETPKEQRPVIPERKRKLPPSNAELDRSIRQKTEEESQEKIEEQNPESKPYMEEEKQLTKKGKNERPEENKGNNEKSRELEFKEVEENLIRMGMSPENITAKTDAHGIDFLSMELLEESIDKETNFPPLKGLPPEDGNSQPPQDNVWAKPPVLKKKPVSEMPSPKKPTTSPTKSITGRGSDGQHGNLPNCGCHDCILQTLIVKGEPKEEGNMISKRLIDQIKKQNKVGQGIPKSRHPPNCLCVYRIDDWQKNNTGEEKHLIPPSRPLN